MSKRKTHEEFVDEIKNSNDQILQKISFVDKYSGGSVKIIVDTKYGKCLVRPKSLFNIKNVSIRSAIEPHDFFIKRLKIDQPEIFNSILKFIDNYRANEKRMIVQTKYGKCSVVPNSLLRGDCITIENALNKNEYFINTLKDRQPEIFNEVLELVGDYVSSRKETVVKTKYGNCRVSPNSLLRGNHPTILSALDKDEYYKNNAIDVHGDRYDYELVRYIDNRKKVFIKCKKQGHGGWWTLPSSHLAGCGCPDCANESAFGMYNPTVANRNKNDWLDIKCFVYILSLSKEDESIFKIGITKDTEKRFYKISRESGFSVQIIDLIQTNAYDGTFIEKELQSMNDENEITLKEKWGGSTECFSDINKETLERIEYYKRKEADGV